MESELQRWMFFGFMFLLTALRSRPAWGERTGRAILRHMAFFFCSFFVAIYGWARLFEPHTLVAGGVTRDTFLWWTAAAATAGVFGGSLCGQWVRRITAGWDFDRGEVRYRLARREPADSGAAKQNRDTPD